MGGKNGWEKWVGKMSGKNGWEKWVGREENEWVGDGREGEEERDGRRKRGLKATTVTQVYISNQESRFTIHTQSKIKNQPMRAMDTHHGDHEKQLALK